MSADPLVQAFFEEARELLSDFEAALLRLEDAPGDNDLLNRIFRSAHTLKGNSAMLGFEEIAHFTHSLEDLLDQLRKGQRTVTPRVIDVLLITGDVLRGLVGRAEEDGRAATADEASARERATAALHAVLRGEAEVEVTAPAADRDPAVFGVRTLYEIIVRPAASGPSFSADALVASLGRLGEVVQVAPLADGDATGGCRIWLVSASPRADVDAALAASADGASVSVDALMMDEPAETPAPPERATPVAASAEPRRRATDNPAVEAASIRVPVDKVDRLIDLVGELVITQAMVAQAVTTFTPDKLPMLEEAVAQMDRHARDLHERMMAVRMVPIKTLFARFPRLVRDLLGMTGKQATLETSGEETELDKTVIEKIVDPLTHLVRNAIDHGLETPEVRRAAGKPAMGRVSLAASQRGGSIFIEIADDGRGLDREKIRAKAIATGCANADEVLTDDQVLALVFRPGFSTAEKVTEVSGRGVGMDVVRQNVEALGGSIAVETAPGRGTTFRVALPLTVAILDGQLLRVGEERYVVPLVSIVESIRPRREHLTRLLGSGETVTVRDRVLPIVRLHRLFDVVPNVEDPTQGLVVIVEQDGRQAALLVDELLNQQQIVIKSLETNYGRVRGVAGATILGDGRVTLILDVPGLLALARGGDAALAA